MRVISLGWGVQSYTLAAMAALGELQADFALHSDTHWEKTATYTFIRKWQPWLESKGLRVVTVGQPNQVVVEKYTGSTDIPAFTATESKTGGQLRRQCTLDWKIKPMRRWLRDELERMGIKQSPGCVTQLLGISLDEYQRMKTSDVKWIENEYPLIDLRMTRADCVMWLERHGLEVPPKSSCVFCPFQGKASWQALKRDDPDGWSQAVAVDEAIRKVRPPFDLFVHRDRIPLVDAVEIAEDYGARQGGLFDDDDPGCESGHCFV